MCLVELEKVGEEITGELIVDFLELLVDTLNVFPKECQLAGDFGQVVSTGIFFLPKAFFDWRESMRVIPYWSKVVKKEETVGYIFMTPMLVSIALIIIGIIAYGQLN